MAWHQPVRSFALTVAEEQGDEQAVAAIMITSRFDDCDLS